MMATGNPDLGEQALGKAMEVGLSSQLDAVETLEAEIRTNPVALMQGELESAAIQGQGLVMKEDLRTEQLTVQTDGIAIDPIKAAFGDIELTRPTNATAAVTLTEVDIQRACNGDYIHRKLQKLAVNLDDRPVRLDAQQIRVSLPGAGRVAIAADVTVVETEAQHHVAFSAIPVMGSQGHEIVLEQVEVAPDNTSDPLTHSLLAVAAELLDLRKFTLSGMTLQIQQIEVQSGKMNLQAQALLEKFPGS
jgi:hypothetical protein